MLERLRDREVRRNLLEKTATFREDKAEMLVYGKKELSKAEYEAYENEFTKLKMSSSISPREVEDFSRRFEQDLDFLCMVGLSSEKNEASREVIDYLRAKEIKTCIFAHQMTEVQSLRPLLRREEGEDDFVELEGRAVEEITYNLNMITRKLNFEQEYRFSLIVGAECWSLLKAHSSLMQHFLLAAYYANCILAHGFTPQEKA